MKYRILVIFSVTLISYSLCAKNTTEYSKLDYIDVLYRYDKYFNVDSARSYLHLSIYKQIKINGTIEFTLKDNKSKIVYNSKRTLKLGKNEENKLISFYHVLKKGIKYSAIYTINDNISQDSRTDTISYYKHDTEGNNKTKCGQQFYLGRPGLLAETFT